LIAWALVAEALRLRGSTARSLPRGDLDRGGGVSVYVTATARGLHTRQSKVRFSVTRKAALADKHADRACLQAELAKSASQTGAAAAVAQTMGE